MQMIAFRLNSVTKKKNLHEISNTSYSLKCYVLQLTHVTFSSLSAYIHLHEVLLALNHNHLLNETFLVALFLCRILCKLSLMYLGSVQSLNESLLLQVAFT
jgi:hypothetical protein